MKTKYTVFKETKDGKTRIGDYYLVDSDRRILKLWNCETDEGQGRDGFLGVEEFNLRNHSWRFQYEVNAGSGSKVFG